MSITSQKFIFGTANLFSKYGQKGILIKKNKSLNLMNFAYKNNVKILDISSDYEIFNEDLKNFNYDKWKISFKITKKILLKMSSKKKIKEFINFILKKFKCKKIYFFLYHHDKDLLTKNGQLFFKYLVYLKKNKIVKKIGVSLYDFKRLDFLLKKFPIDVVQVPFNILDQRLNNNLFKKIISRKKIEVHVRSIFLQGILVDKKLIPSKIKKNPAIKRWFLYIKKNNLNPIRESFKFLNGNKFINKIIIGYRNSKQLKEILFNCNYNSSFDYSIFNCNNKKIIDPRKW